MTDLDPGHLDRELRELAIAWPREPDLAGRVQARLTAQRVADGTRAHMPLRAPARGVTARAPWRPVLTWALVLALITFGATLAVSPSARSAVLELLGLRSVRIERREPSPAPGAGLGLGPRATLGRARAAAGFPVRVPRALGAPDAVHLDPAGGRPRVALVYRARPGWPRLLVQAFRATVTPLAEKSAGAATRVRRVRIGGAPAVFLEGAHGFAFLDQGEAVFEDQRLAGNTLLLERDGVLTRIEGDVPLARAAAIARSLR